MQEGPIQVFIWAMGMGCRFRNKGWSSDKADYGNVPMSRSPPGHADENTAAPVSCRFLGLQLRQVKNKAAPGNVNYGAGSTAATPRLPFPDFDSASPEERCSRRMEYSPAPASCLLKGRPVISEEFVIHDSSGSQGQINSPEGSLNTL